MPSGILRRSLTISILAVVAIAIGLWFGGRAWLDDSVMAYSGQATLPSLDEAVEVRFDDRGIPRIYADTDADALRALGWLHAGERLFQLELIRRMARGELAALVGPAALELDVLHRSFGFARRVEEERPELEAETRALVDAYVEGINARIESGERLPPAFQLLATEPEPWTREDVLAVAYYQTFYPNTLVGRMREAWVKLAREHGQPASDWLSRLPAWTRATLPQGRMTEASNTWVVAPERSSSGAALHAADPHLDVDVAPGLWYAAGIHSAESLDVLGVTVPGLPFVAMGHNGRIAWAFTVAPVDVYELYDQPRHPDDPDRVRGPDGWERIHRREETIEIKGEAAITREFLYTPLGRVVEAEEDSVRVMRWIGFELPLGGLVDNGLALNRADDFTDFRQAATGMGALSVNWSYSDRAGNIGYVQSTPIPIRQHERFFTVLDATDPANDWAGIHPPENRPWALDPERGWLANANNHAAADWGFPIPGFYKHLRMRRIAAALSGSDDISAEDMRALQLSRLSDRALSWRDWLADVAEASGRRAIAEELRAWDGVMRADSDMAGLFQLWWYYLPRAVFGGDDSHWRTLRPLIDNWMHADPGQAFPRDVDREAAALAALEDALKVGIHPLGSLQHLTVRHPLAENALVNAWLDLTRGPVPTGGDAGSPNVSYVSFDASSGGLRVRQGPSMRFIMDWSDPDAFSLELAFGQSGNPFSAHFDDFFADFLAGRRWTLPWSRDEVEARTPRQLELRPARPRE